MLTHITVSRYVGVQSLGVREPTGLQLMQIIGDNRVKIVPKVSANGNGPVEAFVGLLAQQQLGPGASPVSVTGTVNTLPSPATNFKSDKQNQKLIDIIFLIVNRLQTNNCLLCSFFHIFVTGTARKSFYLCTRQEQKALADNL